MDLSVAIVGTGANPDDRSRTGFAMGYRHANAYRRIDGCELVACADIVTENARQFAMEFDIPDTQVFEDAGEMARAVDPDVVSVTVPPAAHASVVADLAEIESVRAIHCEKPMALTWRECREMVTACEWSGVKLTINHQRRFGAPFRRAKVLLDDGVIGPLDRIEFGGENLYDAGTHQFDLCGYYTDQASPRWVLAGLDYSEVNRWFGAHNANQALVQWAYETGVSGLACTGAGSDLVDCYLRLVGESGTIEIGPADGGALRLRRGDGAEWESVDTDGESIHGPLPPSRPRVVAERLVGKLPGVSPDDPPTHHDRAIADVVRALREDDESELAARHALQSTELIFAAWESVRRRARVNLPLRIEDNPLESMVEKGLLDPTPVHTESPDQSTM